jgi:ubiquinone/menaquinone biosynthesis C-methylase UbiE
MKNHVPDNRASLYTCITGDNSNLIANVAKLYVQPGDHILDVTFGRGVFWKKVDRTRIKLVTNDLQTPADYHFDFRKLGFDDASFDHTVFDPPYVHDGKTVILHQRYNNDLTTAKLNYAGIVEMYDAGLRECCRVTKVGGLIWVKGQDQVENHRQCWNHIHLYLLGLCLGLSLQDYFILCNGRPAVRHHPQQHARRNHSFLLIFKKKAVPDKIAELLILRYAAIIRRRRRHQSKPSYTRRTSRRDPHETQEEIAARRA